LGKILGGANGKTQGKNPEEGFPCICEKKGSKRIPPAYRIVNGREFGYKGSRAHVEKGPSEGGEKS